MAQREPRDVEVVCPCCGAQLKVDAELSKVISHQPPPRHTRAPDLDHIGQLLEKEKARREAIFKQSEKDEKVKSDLLDRKFAEALKKTKDEPITRPTRDIDLD
jgi:predicted amidophosphoribosyltransferase